MPFLKILLRTFAYHCSIRLDNAAQPRGAPLLTTQFLPYAGAWHLHHTTHRWCSKEYARPRLQICAGANRPVFEGGAVAQRAAPWLLTRQPSVLNVCASLLAKSSAQHLLLFSAHGEGVALPMLIQPQLWLSLYNSIMG